MKLLIVDDDRALRDALRRGLNLAGYEVVDAGTGLEALEQIREQSPDALILDIGLPDVSGLEVCRRLRAQGQRVPVLMLTARNAVEDRIDGLDAGADDYLVKPFDLGELIARMRALLRRSAPSEGIGDPSFGTLRLDSARHGASVKGNFVEAARALSSSCLICCCEIRGGCCHTPLSTIASGGMTSGPARTRCAATSATFAASSRMPDRRH